MTSKKSFECIVGFCYDFKYKVFGIKKIDWI